MGKTFQLTENEKELLTVIGRNPEISMKELLNHTEYKWVSTVVRKLGHLKEQHTLIGPLYDIDYGKLCKNPLHKLVCIVELNQSYETVISYLKLIDSLAWIFPVLSPHKKVLNAGFFSSNDTELKALLQLLKDNNIISDYIVRVCCHKRMVENPNLFGDPAPSLDNLLNPCDIPDMSLGQYDTEWNECDVRILPYLQKGAKLIEILREEKRVYRSWTYEQVRYSCEKMIKNRLIEKKYIFFPFPCEQCTRFDLFLKTGDISVTQRILCNFARGERVYKEYMLFEDWGMIFCLSHPLFLTDIMHWLDQIDQVEEREVYQVRSTSGEYTFAQPIETKYYDFDKQTLEYPYHTYKEKIHKKLDSELRLLHAVDLHL